MMDYERDKSLEKLYVKNKGSKDGQRQIFHQERAAASNHSDRHARTPSMAR
jgi:hypothetical protein